MTAYGKQSLMVTTSHVAKAIVDTDESSKLGKLLAMRWNLLWPAVGGITAVLLIVMPNWLGSL
jgi:hypothetical protein